MSLISTKIYGKLYLAGEYAVLYDRHPALLMAVDRYVKCDLIKEDEGIIENASYGKINYDSSNLKPLDDQDDPFFYAVNILLFAKEVLALKHKQMKNLHFKIYNQLISDNIKIGLGSSSAFSLALFECIMLAHGISLSKLELYKHMVLCHKRLGKNESFGDLAASSFGGYILYQKPDDAFLDKLDFNDLDKDWPGLKIEKIDFPADLKVYFAWTKESASTTKLVSKVRSYFINNQDYQSYFLNKCDTLTNSLIEMIKTCNLIKIQENIANLNILFEDLSKRCEDIIITPKVKDLIKKCPYSAKHSGAGGGDCVMCINKKEIPITSWENFIDIKVGYYES